MFSKKSGLGPPSLDTLTLLARSGALLLYLLHLQQGNTLLSSMAQADTLRGYLQAAASKVTGAGFPDPLYSVSGNFPGSNPTLLPRFQRHLAEQKRWQAPKDAKIPLTPTMILDIACIIIILK